MNESGLEPRLRNSTISRRSMMMSSHQVRMIAGVAILSTNTALAQAIAQPSEDDPVRYDETVLVTANATPTPRNETPIRTEVIGRGEIEALQAADLTRVLPMLPAIDVAQSGSPGKTTSVFVRGAESDQVLVLWNGIRLNDPYFGGFDWAHLTTDGLDRVEVVYGPSGSLHGSDAIGGTVNLVTRRSGGLGVLFEAGTDGYQRGSLTGGRQTESGSVNASGVYRADDGFADNDDYQLFGAHLDAQWTLTRSSELGLLARASDHELGIPFASGFPSPHRRQEGQSYQVAVPWSWTGSHWTAQAHASGHWTDFAFRDPDSFFSRNDTQAERLGIHALARREGQLGGVAFGAETFSESADNESNFGVALDGEDRRQSAGFAEVDYRLGDRTIAQAGLRLEDDEFFGSESTWRAAVQTQWSARWATWAGYSQGFRVPSLGELFFPFFGNTELDPEEGDTLEAGVRLSAGNSSFELAAFSSDFDNLIDSDPLTFLAANVGAAESDGWEASWVWRGPVYRARAAVTLLDAQTQDGQPLLRRPEERASIGFTRLARRWSVDGAVRYVGERSDLDPATFGRALNPAYAVVDLATDIAVSDQAGWGRLRLRVENALDRDYQQVLGFVSPGRRWVIGWSRDRR